MTDKLLTPEAVAEWLGVPIRTLYTWRYLGRGPESFKVGRHLRYREHDVLRWLEEQRHASRLLTP